MIQLYINETQVEIDSSVSVPLTFQFEDLNNPTVIKNSFSKTIKLPSTKVNDEVFNHIYRIDHSIFDFDPSQRVPFYLLWNGSVIESGYIKLNSIEYIGQYPSYYNITMFGGLGEFFYELSQKNMSDLNLNIEHVINAQTVVDSWEGTKFYAYPLTYSGLYDNFDSNKAFNRLDEQFNQGVSNIIQKDGKFILMTSNSVVTYDPNDNNIVVYPVNFNLGTNIRIMYDYIQERLIAFQIGGRNLYFTSDLSEFTGWSYVTITPTGNWIVDLSIIESDFATYAVLDNLSQIRTGNDLGLLEVKRTLDSLGVSETARIKRWRVEGNPFVYGYVSGVNGSTGTGRDVYYIQQGSTNMTSDVVFTTGNQQVGSELLIANDGNIYNADDQHDPYYVIAAGTALYYAQIKTNAQNPNFTTHVGLGQYNNIEKINNNSLWATGDQFYTVFFVNDDNSIIRQQNVAASGFNILSASYTINDSTDYYLIKYIDENGNTRLAYNRSGSGGFTPLNDYYYDIDQGENVNEYQRNEYRSYYQRPMLKLAILFETVLNGSTDTYQLDRSFFNTNNPYWNKTWIIMSRLQYEGDPPVDHVGNIRSGDTVNYKMIIGSSVTQLDFFLSYIKMFGLIVEKDPIRKHISIKTRKTFFSEYEILDWTGKTDYRKTKTVTPIPFDFKYGILRYENKDSYYESLYNEQHKIDYASVRIDTGYDFNDNDKVFFNNIFQNVVMSTEYDAMFKGRNTDYIYADDKVLPALFTKSGNELSYNDSSFHIVFWDGYIPTNVPVRITDDSELMLELGLYMWNDSNANAITVSEIPNIFRVGQFNGVYYSLDFAKPAELYYPSSDEDYPEESTIYYRYWRNWIAERYNKNNKVLRCGFYLSPIDVNQFEFNQFIQINDTLWHINKIDGYDITKESSTSVELIRVDNLNNYID